MRFINAHLEQGEQRVQYTAFGERRLARRECYGWLAGGWLHPPGWAW